MSPSKAAVEAVEEILDALENPTPDMDDDLKGYIAAIIDRHARSAEVREVIEDLAEATETFAANIDGMCGDPEGATRLRRRAAQARALLATLSNED